MIVCVRMKMCVDVTECMNVWLSPICLSSVNTSKCVCVCMWGDCVKRRVLGGQPGGAPCRWRGWMDECEHLFHAPFTATGLIHLSETLLSSRLSDVHSNPSHWWIIPSPPPPLPHLGFWKMLKKGSREPAAARKCAFVTRVDIRLHLQLYSSLRQVVFFENKCGKTSAEMWSHAARSPLQMVPLGRRGTFQPLSPAVFAHKLPLLLLLSVAII